MKIKIQQNTHVMSKKSPLQQATNLITIFLVVFLIWLIILIYYIFTL